MREESYPLPSTGNVVRKVVVQVLKFNKIENEVYQEKLDVSLFGHLGVI